MTGDARRNQSRFKLARQKASLDALGDRRRIHNCAVDDSFRLKRLKCEVFQLVAAFRFAKFDGLDCARSDIQSDERVASLQKAHV